MYDYGRVYLIFMYVYLFAAWEISSDSGKHDWQIEK